MCYAKYFHKSIRFKCVKSESRVLLLGKLINFSLIIVIIMKAKVTLSILYFVLSSEFILKAE